MEFMGPDGAFFSTVLEAKFFAERAQVGGKRDLIKSCFCSCRAVSEMMYLIARLILRNVIHAFYSIRYWMWCVGSLPTDKVLMWFIYQALGRGMLGRLWQITRCIAVFQLSRL